MGQKLKKLRLELNMPIDVVVESLKELKVKSTKGTISKIERGLLSIRADLLAGLCLVYGGLKPEVILYDYKKKS